MMVSEQGTEDFSNSHRAAYKINDVSLNKADVERRLVEIFATRTDKAIFIKAIPIWISRLVADIIDDGHRAG